MIFLRLIIYLKLQFDLEQEVVTVVFGDVEMIARDWPSNGILISLRALNIADLAWRVASPRVMPCAMRLKTSIWVAGYLRRCQTEGVFGAITRRGAEDAGAVFVKLALLDGTAIVYAPAPQSTYDESRPADRVFIATTAAPVPDRVAEQRLAKEIDFDSDVWIVEIEDRAGRHFLELAKA